MRAASINKTWQVLRRSNKRQIKTIDLRWSKVPGLSDGHIQLSAPITLICGENGAGKSRIMHAIFRAFRSAASGTSSYRFFRRAEGELTRLEVEVKDEIKPLKGKKLSKFFFPDGEADKVQLFCPGLAVAEQLEEIRSDLAFSERLEGAVSRSFNSKQLEQASYVLARTYAAVEAIEVEATSDAAELRFFRAQSHGVTYESMDMGEGELAVFNLLDLLWGLDAGSVLLIEEPESYLAPRAQGALMDVLADMCAENGVTCIASSHSGVLARRLNLDEIFFVSRAHGGVYLESPARKVDLVERLGLLAAKALILFVEDEAARVFCRTILDYESKNLGNRGEIVLCGGASQVLKAVLGLPAGIFSAAHIAVLDGDQRGNEKDSRVCYLPGTTGPDELLHNFAVHAEASKLALDIGVESSVLRLALSKADGLDSHDWVREFGRQVGCSDVDVLRRLTVAWIVSNRAEASIFVKEVEAAAAEQT